MGMILGESIPLLLTNAASLLWVCRENDYYGDLYSSISTAKRVSIVTAMIVGSSDRRLGDEERKTILRESRTSPAEFLSWYFRLVGVWNSVLLHSYHKHKRGWFFGHLVTRRSLGSGG